MAKKFNEHSAVADVTMDMFEDLMDEIEVDYDISFRAPKHDIARRLLNEIVEFESMGE